ncbi:MAG TPA: VOC family protein [Burkholderiales bacterium]|nr:VOC family protein [Burkholderiales bacterium]
MLGTLNAASQQLPPPGSINVDHVAHFVPDSERAAAALTQLGFTLTPFSVQAHRLTPDGPLVPAGTGNRCVMLERGYIEFLVPLAETPVADQLRTAMQRYVGVHLIAFGTAAAEKDHARLVHEGFAPQVPIALQRPIATEGGTDTARFTVVRVAPGTMPEGRIQYCQQVTPELVWQPRWLTHANGATALTSVLLCVADPAETAQRYARYTGLATAARNAAWEIETARGRLVFVDDATLTRALGVRAPALPWIAGYSLASQDLAATREYLQAAGIVAAELPGKLMVTLPEALGGLVLFEDPGSGRLEFT